LKYKLLEWRTRDITEVCQWIASTPALENARKQLNMSSEDFQGWLPQALVKSNAAVIEHDRLINLD
jgi:hypothetical protein